ncbi:MFS transporter [Actinocorallia herbida]|uniref:MFS transporter n=1 Tax=Actinocorallia herbida TaxID=58109 RepID=A0A3N1D202_9ACTN|nr:MFS transporter [Actinocorallia herbida]ROO87516.1 MFS transporter [Actinocorallia herbida]
MAQGADPQTKAAEMSLTTPAEADARPLRPLPFTIGILILAAIVSSFESTMMYTALPEIIEHFDTTPGNAGWILTSFLLVGAASAAISGKLGDAFGRRNLLIVVLAASTIGSLVSLAADSLAMIIVGRAIQGLAGGLIPLCIGVLRETVPRKSLPVAVAVVAGAAMWGGAAGNVVSGNIVDAWGWHYTFVVAAALAAVSAIGACFLPRPVFKSGLERIDWLGGVLFAPGIGLALYGVHESSEWGWTSGKTIGFILGGLVILALWVAWELRVDAPLINIRFFLNRKLGLTLIASALVSFGTLGVSGFVGQMIMQSPESAPVGFGLSAGTAGALSFGIGLIGFVLSPLSGRISRNNRSRNAFVIGAFLGIAAAALSALLLDSLVGFVISQIVLTGATSFILSSLPNLVVEGAPDANTSEAQGVYMVTQTAFAGVGSSIGTVLLSQFLIEGTHFSSRAGYNTVFAMVAIATAVALLVALFIRVRPQGTDDVEDPRLSPVAVPDAV